MSVQEGPREMKVTVLACNGCKHLVNQSLLIKSCTKTGKAWVIRDANLPFHTPDDCPFTGQKS